MWKLFNIVIVLIVAHGRPHAAAAFQCPPSSPNCLTLSTVKTVFNANANYCLDPLSPCEGGFRHGGHHLRHQFQVLTFLSATTEDSDTKNKESKPRRLVKGFRKILSYPKEKVKKKLKKLRSSGEDSEDSSAHASSTDSKDDKQDKSGDISADATTQISLETGHQADAVTAAEASATASNMNMGLGSNTSPATMADTAVAVETKQERGTKAVNANEEKSSDSEEITTASGSRSATSEVTDLSGSWELIVDEDFKKDYDQYLQDLGQPSLVRSVALSIIGMTAEEVTQTHNGKELNIRGRNVRGNWERTLKASTKEDPIVTPIITADKEEVLSECWWEEEGKVHRSWLRGVEKYGGGDFESKRYLDHADGEILVCESVFHPNDETKSKASVVWRFQKRD